jgi:hypothetical protein
MEHESEEWWLFHIKFIVAFPSILKVYFIRLLSSSWLYPSTSILVSMNKTLVLALEHVFFFYSLELNYKPQNLDL